MQEKLTLGGDGGGVFDLEARGTVTLTRATTAGPPATQVAAALAGRAPIPAVLGDLPASSRAAPCPTWRTSSTRLPGTARPENPANR